MRTLALIGIILVAAMTEATTEPAPGILEINTTLMETTFRITGPSSKQLAATSGGTVFILGKPTGDGTRAFFVLVTAAHVLDDIAGNTANIDFHFKDENGKFSERQHPLNIRENGKNLYVKHPDVDIAAIYVRMPNEFTTVKMLAIDFLITDDGLKKYEIHPGDELLCLGFPLFAKADHGFPILRSGKIASYPLVPSKEHKNWLFDFRVFPGNSGGPVYFIDRNRVYGGETKLGETIQFVAGLVTSQLSSAVIPNTDLQIGVVIPAVFIRETLQLLPAISPYN